MSAIALGVSTDTGAMTHGVRSSAQPWMALIITNGLLGLNEEPNCSGALVADGWVLTAAHCVTSSGRTVSRSRIRVLIGRDDRDAKDQGAAYGVASIVRMPGFENRVRNDAALIQLENFETKRWHAIPLAFEATTVNTQGGVTLYGYGAVGWNLLGSQTGAGRLWKSPDGAFVRDPSCDRGLACIRREAEPRTMGGDSGGPWLRWTAGAWQLIGVHQGVSGDGRNDQGDPAWATSTRSRLPDGRTMLEWVRATAAIPVPRAETIVRDNATGNAWLVASDGYRRWIPNGRVYQCLVARGQKTLNLPQISIDTIPDRVREHAACDVVEVIYKQGPSIKASSLDGGDPRTLVGGLPRLEGGVGIDVTRSAIWWIDGSGIWRADRDGMGKRRVVAVNGAYSDVIVAGRFLYWTRWNEIWRSSLDGNGRRRILTLSEEGSTRGRVADMAGAGNYLYFVTADSCAIGRVRLDGQRADSAFVDTPYQPCLIQSVAVVGGYIYWANTGGAGFIGRARLDGGAAQPTWFATRSFGPLRVRGWGDTLVWRHRGSDPDNASYLGKVRISARSDVRRVWIRGGDDLADDPAVAATSIGRFDVSP